MKTCEEYVLEELQSTKEKLDLATKAEAKLEEEYLIALTGYKKLIDLVVKGTKGFEFKEEDGYVKVYWNGYFVTLGTNKAEDEQIEALRKLVEKGKAISSD